MNFKYDEHDGAQPGQPLRGYTIVLGGPQGAPQPQPNIEDQYKLTAKQLDEIHEVKIRNMRANTRANEVQVMLQGLREIRTALDQGSITIAENDSGSGERPPLEPAFDETNRLMLQRAYLRMVERYVNYTEDQMKCEMKIEFSNEINKINKINKIKE
jgi:hypothetical protein